MARGLVAVVPITASEELHLALKQTFLFYFFVKRWNQTSLFRFLFNHIIYEQIVEVKQFCTNRL